MSSRGGWGAPNRAGTPSLDAPVCRLSADYTAATFGQEAAQPHSLVAVAVFDSARRAVHAALDISMFVRTRKPSGHIFYLGSLPRCAPRRLRANRPRGPPTDPAALACFRRFGQTDETMVGASLKGGELLVHLRFNQTPEDYTVGGTRLDNGHLHLIEVPPSPPRPRAVPRSGSNF